MPFEDKALRSKLKRRFKVWAMVENREFGQVRMYMCIYDVGAMGGCALLVRRGIDARERETLILP